jgi:hypothetical protein
MSSGRTTMALDEIKYRTKQLFKNAIFKDKVSGSVEKITASRANSFLLSLEHPHNYERWQGCSFSR